MTQTIEFKCSKCGRDLFGEEWAVATSMDVTPTFSCVECPVPPATRFSSQEKLNQLKEEYWSARTLPCIPVTTDDMRFLLNLAQTGVTSMSSPSVHPGVDKQTFDRLMRVRAALDVPDNERFESVFGKITLLKTHQGAAEKVWSALGVDNQTDALRAIRALKIVDQEARICANRINAATDDADRQ